jgi:hypothetical protein
VIPELQSEVPEWKQKEAEYMSEVLGMKLYEDFSLVDDKV